MLAKLTLFSLVTLTLLTTGCGAATPRSGSARAGSLGVVPGSRLFFEADGGDRTSDLTVAISETTPRF